jgi:Peptidase family M3
MHFWTCCCFCAPQRPTLNCRIMHILMHMQELREKLYRAHIQRASDGDKNNAPIINTILSLKREFATLLGFKTYAEVRSQWGLDVCAVTYCGNRRGGGRHSDGLFASTVMPMHLSFACRATVHTPAALSETRRF